jgi:hypothetical protein
MNPKNKAITPQHRLERPWLSIIAPFGSASELLAYLGGQALKTALALVLFNPALFAEVRYGTFRSSTPVQVENNDLVQDLGGTAFLDRPLRVGGAVTGPVFELIATSTPTTPSSGRCRIWFNSTDNALRVLYDDGSVDELGVK